MRKSIHLVSQLFYESGKAVQAMPFVVLQPFLVGIFGLGHVENCYFVYLFVL